MPAAKSHVPTSTATVIATPAASEGHRYVRKAANPSPRLTEPPRTISAAIRNRPTVGTASSGTRSTPRSGANRPVSAIATKATPHTRLAGTSRHEL